jgi:hypothetical protein
MNIITGKVRTANDAEPLSELEGEPHNYQKV